MNRKQMILLGVLWIVLLVGVGKFVFKEEQQVTEKGVEVHETEVVNVVIDGPKLSIYSFEKGVGGLEWIDDESFVIKGKKDNAVEEESYIFYMSDHHMEQYEQTTVSQVSEGYEALSELADGKKLCTDKEAGKGLYIQDQANVKTLSEDVLFQKERIFTVSDDGDKIAYYDAKDQKIRIYGLSTGKTANINVFPDEVILRDFERSILFAPESGYVALYYYVPEALQETYFSVYGADSGRSYSDRIWGLDPSWAPEELKIAYLYGENAATIESTDGSIFNRGKRLGYYDLKKRKSFYTGAVRNSGEIIPPIKWSVDGSVLGYYSGAFNETKNQWELVSFYTYQLNDEVFKMDSLEEAYGLNDLMEWSFNASSYWKVWNKSEQAVLSIMNRNTRRILEINPCESFLYNGDESYVEMIHGKILYKKDGYLYVADQNSQNAILTRDADLLEIQGSPNENYISVISVEKERYIIDVVKLDENVSVQ